jgi:hypothetical protein
MDCPHIARTDTLISGTDGCGLVRNLAAENL